MAGLMTGMRPDEMPPEDGGAPREAMPPQGGGPDNSNVSPEEQQQYEGFVGNYLRLVYQDDEMRPALLESLGGDGNPVEGLANTAAMVVKRLVDSARGKGADISQDVIFHAGAEEIIPDLAELQADAKIADLGEQEIEAAMYRALDIYREAEMGEGNLDTETLSRDMAEMVEADKQGRLGEMVPGAEKAAQRLGREVEGEQGGRKPPEGPGNGLMTGMA